MGLYKDTLLLVDKVTEPLKKIQQNSNKATEKTEKLSKKTKLFGGVLKDTEARLRLYNRRLLRANEALEKSKKKYEQIENLGGKIKGIGQGLTVGLTLPIVGLGAAMIKSAADMEAMQTQLNTMLGSADAGEKMFKDIQLMAAKTPFDASDLMEVTNTMLGFGQAQEKVLPLMKEIGDISGGNKDKFKSLALAFSQASSVGKLQGQDWLQMVNAGFNPLEAISKRTGKSIGVLKEEMSKGKISIQMVEQAMKDVTSEGGRFYKMMEKQSESGLGQWSTFMGQVNLVSADFGKIILPYAIKGMQKLSKGLEWFQSLTDKQKKRIIIIGAIVAAIGPLLVAAGGLLSTVATLMPLLQVLPVILPAVGAAIGGVTAAVGLSVAAFMSWAWAIKSIKGELAAWGDTTKGMDEKLKINNLNTSGLSNSSLEKLQYQRKQMGDKAYKNKYGKEGLQTLKDAEKSGRISKTGNPMGTTNNNQSYTYNTTNNYGLGGGLKPLGSPSVVIAG